MADIFFSTMDRSEVYQLPVLPPTLPELNRASKNEEFETFNDGTYNIPGNVGLFNFEIERFLPALNKDYPFAKCKINPYLLINLWSGAMDKRTPIRIIINRNKGLGLPEEAVNMLVTVENMSYYEDNTGDVVYKLSLKEYREIK